MSRGEGIEESDEPLSHEAAVDLVRQRASEQRGRSEPDGFVAPARRQGRLAIMLPDPNLGGRTRAFLKRAVARLTRWQLVPLVRQLNEARAEQQEKLAVLEAKSKEQAAAVEELRQVFEQLVGDAEELAEQRRRAAQLGATLESVKRALDERIDELRGGLGWLHQLRGEDRAELTSALTRIRSATEQRRSSGPADQPGAEDGAGDLAAFYEAHQERFRGSRESVRERLEIYLPYVRAVASPDHQVLDLGPGRGEWLALLRESGIAAYGVDVNSAFVAGAAEAGLDVLLGDAVEHLRGLPDRSLAAVTAFHLVEHIPARALIELVDNALRALRPGGLLILETPNPLNLKVGAASFHLDPTHLRPIHPLFLEFVLENRGFTEVRTLTVNPPPEPPLAVQGSPDGRPPTLGRVAELLNEAFFTGMDYAVIGRRADPAPDRPGSWAAAPTDAPPQAPSIPTNPPRRV